MSSPFEGDDVEPIWALVEQNLTRGRDLRMVIEMQRRPTASLLVTGCLALTLSGCVWPVAPVDESTACQFALSSRPGGPFSINDDESVRDSLETCSSKEEWVTDALYRLPAPNHGDEAEVRQLLEELCDELDLSDTQTCQNERREG